MRCINRFDNSTTDSSQAIEYSSLLVEFLDEFIDLGLKFTRNFVDFRFNTGYIIECCRLMLKNTEEGFVEFQRDPAQRGRPNVALFHSL